MRPTYTTGAVERRKRRLRERVAGLAMLAIGTGCILLAAQLWLAVQQARSLIQPAKIEYKIRTIAPTPAHKAEVEA